MEGHRVDETLLPVDAYRDWQCAAKFGWTPEQTDATSAVRLDWLLAVDHVVEQVKADQQKEK